MSEFGDRIRQLRLKERYSQKQIVQYLETQGIHISQSLLSRIEKGDREPNMSIQSALADFFNVSIDYLYGKEKRTVRLIDPLESEESGNNSNVSTKLNERENAFLEDYRSLNENGKSLAENQLRGLTGVPSLSSKNQKIGAEYDTSVLIAASGSEGMDEEQKLLAQEDARDIMSLFGGGDDEV